MRDYGFTGSYPTVRRYVPRGADPHLLGPGAAALRLPHRGAFAHFGLLNERIRNNAGELRLHGIAESPDELVERAEASDLGYREFLDLVLESEVGVLEGRRYAQRLKMAGLPHHKDAGGVRLLLSARARPQAPRRAALGLAMEALGKRAQTFGDEVLAAAILDRLLHDAEALTINGPSYRLKGRLEALGGSGEGEKEGGE